VHRTWKTSALLRVVEGRAQGVCSRDLGGIRVYKLRRDSSFRACCGNRPRKSSDRTEPWEAGGFLKRKRIDDLKFLGRIAKSRRPLDLGEVARDLTFKRRQNPIAIAYRHIEVGECKSCMHVEIASRDFPI
jgi:hypothetical protein